MQMPETDLLGDPIPEPLPEGERLIDTSQLQRHTILAVFDSPTGRYESDMVIVTATRCWLVLRAAVDGCGEDSNAFLEVKARTYGSREAEVLHDYVSARELLEAECINEAEYTYLKALEDKRAQEATAARAARLRAELAKLEGQTPAAPVTPEDLRPEVQGA